MSSKLVRSPLVATALIAISLSGTGCKKEESKETTVPSSTPTQQAAAPSQGAAQQATPQGGAAYYDFERNISGWFPKSKEVSVQQSKELKHSGKNSIRISSNNTGGLWNFAASPKIKLEAGKKYKLSCWMYIDSWDNEKFPPLLKFAISKDNKFVDNAFTAKYDLKKKKEWQRLVGIVVAPQGGSIDGFIAMEKATQDPIAGTIYLDDVKLEPTN